MKYVGYALMAPLLITVVVGAFYLLSVTPLPMLITMGIVLSYFVGFMIIVMSKEE